MAEETEKKEKTQQEAVLKAEPAKEEPKQKESSPEAHVAKYKQKAVERFAKLIKEYPIIGAVNMENMPAPQLQTMRGQLRDSVVILMNKRRLMKIAIEQCKKDKKGIEKIEAYLGGMPALLFTKENPFKLYKIIDKSKSPAPAKPGQTAPRDIVVPAGPTPFAPGPVIGELGAIGIKTEVKEGKIAIKTNSVVVKEGQEIKANVAGLLTRLGITPMEIGLDLVAVYEDGVIYDKKILSIDEKQFMNNLNNAARWAFNLAVEAGHYTKETVNVLIPKAFRAAKAVSIEAGILNESTRDDLLAKAERQAKALEASIPELPAEAPKEEPKVKEKAPEPAKEEPKAEEKPKEEEKKPEEAPAKLEKPKKEPAKEKSKPAKKEPEPETPEEPKEKPEKQAIEEKEEEIKEELEEIKEDIEEAKKDPNTQEIKEIEKEVEKVEKEQEEVDEMKEELKEREINETKKQQIEAGEKLYEELHKKKIAGEEVTLRTEPLKEAPKPKPAPKPQSNADSEKLFQELKKKGTLRGIETEDKKPSKILTPEEIIKQGQEKMKGKDYVPSAHDLLKKKLRK